MINNKSVNILHDYCIVYLDDKGQTWSYNTAAPDPDEALFYFSQTIGAKKVIRVQRLANQTVQYG